MKIAVYGAGAIGSYYAGHLIRAGQDVVLIGRGVSLEAIRQSGLRIDHPEGPRHIESVQITDNTNEVGPVDLIVVAVKAWQVSEIAPSLEPMIGQETAVLPLQNGVEAADQLAEVVGKSHVLNGTTKVIVQVLEPGRIKDLGFEPWIAAGELTSHDSERLDRIRRTFESAGVRFEIPSDIEVTIWEKFLFIVAVSGVGAITRSEIGILRTLTRTRTLIEESMLEAFRVGRAKGVALDPDVVAKTMRFVDSLPESSTASLQRDIMDGKPSELESQTGAVVRLGHELGVDVPLSNFIYSALLPMERAARGQ